jgi:hypothetical protein
LIIVVQIQLAIYLFLSIRFLYDTQSKISILQEMKGAVQ